MPQREAAARNLVAGWEQLVDVVMATSNAIVDNLFDMLGEAGEPLLQRTPMVVVSQRMAEYVVGRGCEIVFLADSARDNDMLNALCEVNEDVA